MNKLQINLIPGEERASFEIGGLIKKLKFSAIFLLSLFIIASGITFLFFFRLSNQNKEILNKISQTEKKIDSFQSREANLLVLKDRLSLARKIIESREGNINIITNLNQISSAAISFDLIESQGRGVLKANVSSPDLLAMNRFVTVISGPDFTKDFSSLEISSISRSEEGYYTFVLEAIKAIKK